MSNGTMIEDILRMKQNDYELSSKAGHNTDIIIGLKGLITVRPDIQLTLYKEEACETNRYYLTTDRYFYEVSNNRVFISSVNHLFEKFKTPKPIERRVLAMCISN